MIRQLFSEYQTVMLETIDIDDPAVQPEGRPWLPRHSLSMSANSKAMVSIFEEREAISWSWFHQTWATTGPSQGPQHSKVLADCMSDAGS